MTLHEVDASPKITATQKVPSVEALIADLKICSKTRNLQRGKQIHTEATRFGHHSNIYVANSLINMYVKCGSMEAARLVFDSMKQLNTVTWNALILGYAENGQGFTALELFNRMKPCGHGPNVVTFLAALKACISLALTGASGMAECRYHGKQVHDLAVSNGCHSNIFVQNTLIVMYSKCGSMADALEVFLEIKHPDVVSLNAMILGHAENGQGLAALNLFVWMRTRGPVPNYVTLIAVLKACTSLAKGADGCKECRNRGKEIHEIAVKQGLYSNIYVQNTLIDMYSKCGSMDDARHVFNSMEHPNVVSWTALILGHAENGQGFLALDLLKRMRVGPAPNSVTLVAALKACIYIASTERASWQRECRDWGKVLHNFAVETGCDSDIYVHNTLIDMYVKCNSMVDARQVFEGMKHPDVVSWNVLIWGYAENGQSGIALDLFTRMRSGGPEPDCVTFSGALKACALLGALEFGKTIHAEIDRVDAILVTCLVDFYGKCGNMVQAQRIFDLHAKTRDLMTWNAMLAGFSGNGDTELVFELFKTMQDEGLRPDAFTFSSILTCCSHAGLVEKGEKCFQAMPSSRYGIIPTIEHYSCMVDMFGRVNKLDDVMALLVCMPCNPRDVIWTTVLGACCKWNHVEVGRLAFESLIKLNDGDAAFYVLMGQIYQNRGMFQEQEMVMALRTTACKNPGQACWTNEVGEANVF